jgi:ZIP family zinc transporter
MIPVWAQAGGWGIVGGVALVLGGVVGFFVAVPQRIIAAGWLAL